MNWFEGEMMRAKSTIANARCKRTIHEKVEYFDILLYNYEQLLCDTERLYQELMRKSNELEELMNLLRQKGY